MIFLWCVSLIFTHYIHFVFNTAKQAIFDAWFCIHPIKARLSPPFINYPIHVWDVLISIFLFTCSPVCITVHFQITEVVCLQLFWEILEKVQHLGLFIVPSPRRKHASETQIQPTETLIRHSIFFKGNCAISPSKGIPQSVYMKHDSTPSVPRKRIRGMYPPSGLKASSFGSSSSCSNRR